MGARDEILTAVRAGSPPPVALPEEARFRGIRYPDLRDQFARSVAGVGGTCVFVRGPLEEALRAIPQYRSAARVASLVAGVQRANVDPAAVSDPHTLSDVDFCVLPAELGVAENGAVWITNHGGLGRAVAFLTQQLAIVLRAETLVHNMHEAYQHISIPRPGFGVFLSGPSKTADIEQALVIGAHGARSCTVLLLE